jgi:hypothetical protein
VEDLFKQQLNEQGIEVAYTVTPSLQWNFVKRPAPKGVIGCVFGDGRNLACRHIGIWGRGCSDRPAVQSELYQTCLDSAQRVGFDSKPEFARLLLMSSMAYGASKNFAIARQQYLRALTLRTKWDDSVDQWSLTQCRTMLEQQGKFKNLPK